MAKNVNKEAAKVAAEWWTRQVKKNDPNKFDNGEGETKVGFMMMMMAAMLANPCQATEKQLNKFCQKLEQIILDKLEKGESVYLRCDYGPDELLDEIAQQTGINGKCFPYKRYMWVKPGEVKIQDGYDAPTVVIYQEEEV